MIIIDSAIARGQATAMYGPEARRPSSSPVVHPPCDDHFIAQDVQRKPKTLRTKASLLRYHPLQNAPIARADTTLPGPKTTDNDLLAVFANHFGDLSIFLGMTQGLTRSSLLKIAALPLKGD